MNHLRRFSLSLLAAAIITGCAFGQNQMSYQVIVAPESMQPSGNLGVLVILKSDAATFDVRLSYYDNVGDFRETMKTVTVADASTPVTVLFSAPVASVAGVYYGVHADRPFSHRMATEDGNVPFYSPLGALSTDTSFAYSPLFHELSAPSAVFDTTITGGSALFGHVALGVNANTPLYRCTAPGYLRTGAITSVAGDCGRAVDIEMSSN